MKQKVVVQLEDGCRVLINPEPSEYEHLTHIVNPNLALVRGLSPEDWKIVAGIVTAEDPNLLPPVSPRSYEQVQADFLDLRCDIDRKFAEETAIWAAQKTRLEARLERLRFATKVAVFGFSVALVTLTVVLLPSYLR